MENRLFRYTNENSQFGIHECTLGFGGGGRVDYITIDTKETIRCYEIKISVTDFNSKHGHNFKGHLNYYVLPKEIYEKVKDKIPKHIGVYIEYDSNNLYCIKKGKRQTIKNVDKIKSYMIRSLYREYMLHHDSEDIKVLKSITKSRNYYKYKLTKTNNELDSFMSAVYLAVGRDKLREIKDSIDN